MEQYLLEQKAYKRVDKLSTLTTHHGLMTGLKKDWEGVDQDILRASSLHAEKSVAKKHRPPWSFALHQASLRATYWKITLSGKWTHRVVNTVLEALAEGIKWDPASSPTNMSISNIQVQLRLV